MSILNELKKRGFQNILIACMDGLKGFPEAIEALYSQTKGPTVYRSPGSS
ncbi:MAG: transposase [Desulfomonilaceae bacterium]